MPISGTHYAQIYDIECEHFYMDEMERCDYDSWVIAGGCLMVLGEIGE